LNNWNLSDGHDLGYVFCSFLIFDLFIGFLLLYTIFLELIPLHMLGFLSHYVLNILFLNCHSAHTQGICNSISNQIHNR
jgi:hypothetical protein